MKCEKAMDLLFDYYGEPMPLLVHLRTAIHLFLCPACTRKNELMEESHEILTTGFFPSAPELEEAVMNKIAAEKNIVFDSQDAETHMVPGELSTRGWVIAGIIILISLASIYFGLDYNKLVHAAGISFLLPISITVGIVLTSYGALFIGSHLKELSKRFGL